MYILSNSDERIKFDETFPKFAKIISEMIKDEEEESNESTQIPLNYDTNTIKRCIEFCKEQDKKGNLVMYCNRDFDDDFYTKNKARRALLPPTSVWGIPTKTAISPQAKASALTAAAIRCNFMSWLAACSPLRCKSRPAAARRAARRARLA